MTAVQFAANSYFVSDHISQSNSFIGTEILMKSPDFRVARSGKEPSISRGDAALSLSLYLFSDPRVKDWMWMQSPFPTIVMATLYLLFVRVAPGYMKDREPYQMKAFLFVFNTAIVLLNAYLTKEVYLPFFKIFFFLLALLYCQPIYLLLLSLPFILKTERYSF